MVSLPSRWHQQIDRNTIGKNKCATKEWLELFTIMVSGIKKGKKMCLVFGVMTEMDELKIVN